MPKQRISSVDIRYLVQELKQTCVGLRLANLYDVTPKVYMLKFAKPERKEYVIVESGVRIHTTGFARAKPLLPSSFTMKLRKHLRTWRLEHVEQLGVDRVIDFTFGRETATFHLLFEFYAKGNIILTDHEYTIITLLRTHRQDEDSLFAVRERYPVERAVRHTPMTEARLLGLLEAGAPGTPIKQLLNSQTEYGPAQIDHCLLAAEVKPSTKLTPGFAQGHRDEVQRLLSALQQIDALLLHPETSDTSKALVYKRQAAAGAAAPADGEDAQLYEHFSAFPLNQYAGAAFEALPFPSFNAAVDHYFSKFEDLKAGQEVEGKQQQKLSKVDKVKKDHEERIRELQRVQELSEHKAHLIIFNAEEVDAAIAVVRSALAQSVDWAELRRVVKEQRRAGNPIAMLIHGFHFEQNRITLLLTDNTDDAAEADLTAPAEEVAVDIALSAHANARAYFDAKKKSAAKEDKTKAATLKAMKSAQKKADEELKKEVPSGPAIKAMRKPYWFEKFNWFITTENFLVLSGRDAQQNELLVKRHLRPGDLYVHADLHGASSCILKNPSGKVVPPVSLSQAGTLCVCRSSAWDNKIVTSAWWVYHNQVSKTAPTGEYLPTGSFMIRGKKNFLPPNPLVMGLAMLWKVAEECVPNHLHERRPPEQFSLNAYHLQTMPEPVVRTQSIDEGSALPSVSLTAGDAVSEASPPPDAESRRPSAAASPESPPDSSDDSGAGAEPCGDAEGESRDAAEPATVPREVNTDFGRYGLYQTPFDPSLGTAASPAPHCGRRDRAVAGAEGSVDPPEGLPDKGGRKRMSAKERRVLRLRQRGRATAPPASEAAEGEEEGEEERDRADPTTPLSSPPGEADEKKAPAAPLSKAQKAKLKKIQQKYGEQDEDDRLLAMLLLGHKPKAVEAEDGPAPAKAPGKKGPPDPPSGGAARREKGGKADVAAKQRPPETTNGAVKPPPSPGPSRATPGPTWAEVMNEAEPPTPKASAEEAEAVRRLLHDEGLRPLGEEEREHLDPLELDALTGAPLDSDTLLFAVPMCAPYSALQGYKFKVKMTPGPLKRGKAAQAIEKHFLGLKEATEREKALLRVVDHTEMIAAVLGNCRLSIAGPDKAGGRPPKGGRKATPDPTD